MAAQSVTPYGAKLPPLGPVTAATPAKQIFGRASAPADLPQQAIGFYAKGCLAGASVLPMTGPTWQVMRPSRHRYFGHRTLVAFLERFSARVARDTGWPGILVGDMSQPRGGPMINGHASHQVGLDADVWLAPMPDQALSVGERETRMSTNVVRGDHADIDTRLWTPDHLRVIRAAAQDPAVERIFVNPAIKKAICRDATGDRSWLSKVRPMWGHDYHFHVRIGCPAADAFCKTQPAPADNDGCGADLAWWMTPGRLNPRPAPPPKVPPKPPHQTTLAELPAQCRMVLDAPARGLPRAAESGAEGADPGRVPKAGDAARPQPARASFSRPTAALQHQLMQPEPDAAPGPDLTDIPRPPRDVDPD